MLVMYVGELARCREPEKELPPAKPLIPNSAS